jgi:hypothetical protein
MLEPAGGSPAARPPSARRLSLLSRRPARLSSSLMWAAHAGVAASASNRSLATVPRRLGASDGGYSAPNSRSAHVGVQKVGAPLNLSACRDS